MSIFAGPPNNSPIVLSVKPALHFLKETQLSGVENDPTPREEDTLHSVH